MASTAAVFRIEKTCARCREVKPRSEFGISSRDGYQSYCKTCNAAAGLESYYRKNPDKRQHRRINFEDQTRQCTRCEEWKPWSAFSTAGKNKKYPHSRCNACVMQGHKDKRAKNPELYRQIQRRNDYKTKYGITLEQYEAMLEAQEYGCKICGSKKSGRKSGVFLVDHDHKSGAVRSLLCARCNVGLGNFDDDLDRLRRAVRYVETGGVL